VPEDINDKLRWYWNEFAKSNPKGGMTWEEWLVGSQVEKSEEKKEKIREEFKKYANNDTPQTIRCNDFMAMAGDKRDNTCYQGQVLPKKINNRLRWYWNNFVNKKSRGMFWKEFLAGSKVEAWRYKDMDSKQIE